MRFGLISFLGLVLLGVAGCTTASSNREPMGQFFNGAASSNQIVPMGQELASHVPDPASTIFMLYNHGTNWGGHFQDCEPDSMPDFLQFWAYRGIAEHNVVVFYLCTQEVEDRAAIGKARSIENEGVLDRLLAAGIPRQNIFVVGHSGGASTALLTAERAPEKFNSAIASAPGYGFAWLEAEGEGSNYLDIEYSKWRTELVTADDMSAFVFAYEGDLYSPPHQATFLRSLPKVEFVTIHDENGDGELCRGLDEPHFFWWTQCFVDQNLGDLETFVIDRLNDRQWDL